MLTKACLVLEPVVSHDAVQRVDQVFDADLLAFFPTAAVVADGDFLDTYILLCNLGGDFGFETKSRLLDMKLVENVATERFVASLHVGQLQSGQSIGEGC